MGGAVHCADLCSISTTPFLSCFLEIDAGYTDLPLAVTSVRPVIPYLRDSHPRSAAPKSRVSRPCP
jgi:hypothetical protein